MSTGIKKKNSNPIATMLVITVGFLVVYVVTKHHWALLTAILVGLIGIFSTYLSEKIDFLWMKISSVLSVIMPNVLLTVIFYLFVYPIALASRVFSKKDSLNLKSSNTTFVTVNKVFDKTDFENPW